MTTKEMESRVHAALHRYDANLARLERWEKSPLGKAYAWLTKRIGCKACTEREWGNRWWRSR